MTVCVCVCVCVCDVCVCVCVFARARKRTQIHIHSVEHRLNRTDKTTHTITTYTFFPTRCIYSQYPCMARNKTQTKPLPHKDPFVEFISKCKLCPTLIIPTLPQNNLCSITHCVNRITLTKSAARAINQNFQD